MREVLRRYGTDVHASTPLGPQRSTLGAPASDADVTRAWGGDAPAELCELWRLCGEAVLFEDVTYGQWGLRILGPAASRRATDKAPTWLTPGALVPGDIVIGEFLGDLELLIYSSSGLDRQRVLVTSPTEPRSEWWSVATTLVGFLERYLDAGGDKYWERH